MSRPVLSSVVHRLSRPRSAASAFSPGSSFSASFCRSSQQSGCRAFSRSSKNCLQLSATVSRRPTAPVRSTQQRFPFSASAVRPASKVVQNPRVDDDGNPLMMTISPRAAERLREITDPSLSPSATKEENPYHHLRITVTSGGCHGFQYLMSLEGASKIDAEEDTIFEADPPEGCPTSTGGNAQVVMDEPSLELLYGSTVDYTTELIGSQFVIADNPRAVSNCGCGTSFDVVD